MKENEELIVLEPITTRVNHKGTRNPNYSHGMSKEPIYSVWQTMKDRCKNKKNKRYEYYGARGISYCEDWENPAAFFDWALSSGYRRGLTLDRKNNDSGYSPENCRWVTPLVNSRNTRRIRKSNKSGYRGVRKRGEKWTAQIRAENKIVSLGTYDYPWTAAYAYDAYVIKHNMENTRNFKEVA